MAGTLTVQTLQGPSSGANANKLLIPSGQTLDVSSGTLVPSAGQVVQTQYAQLSTDTTYSTTLVRTNVLSASITPTSTTSKILILYTFASIWKASSTVSTEGEWTIGKNGSQHIVVDGISPYTAEADRHSTTVSGTYLDSPATTSSITYDISLKLASGSGGIRLNTEGGLSSITLMEIAQ